MIPARTSKASWWSTTTPDRYGQIQVFEIRSDQPIDGPALFNSNIQTEEEISERLTLLNQNGSVVRPGNLLLIPVENSLLYVRPLFIAATGPTAVPELQLVIAGIGSNVVISETFEGALEKAIGASIDIGNGTVRLPDAAPAAPDDTEDEPATAAPDDEPAEPDTAPDTNDVGDLLERAARAFERADTALREGDLAAYQEAVDEAERLIARAARILEQAATG